MPSGVRSPAPVLAVIVQPNAAVFHTDVFCLRKKAIASVVTYQMAEARGLRRCERCGRFARSYTPTPEEQAWERR